MKKVILVIVGLFLIIGCNAKNINSQPKRALVDTKFTNLKTGIVIDSGWEEVRILEEKGNMAKVQWISGGQISWINIESDFKRID
jgi:uncharacterized protein YcfL